MQGSVVPINDEQAKLGSKALDVASGLGRYIEKILGTVPEDLVGLLGGDWLKAKRTENLFKTLERFDELLRKRNVKNTLQLSPNVAVPMLEAATNESRTELQDLWARLMAAAVDPNREKNVRASFVTVVKQMDVMDALVFAAYDPNITHLPNGLSAMATTLKVPEDEVEVSFDNLLRLGLYVHGPGNSAVNMRLTGAGRLLRRTLKD